MPYKIENGRLVEDIGEEPSMFDFYYPTQDRLDEKQYYKAVDEYNYRLANRKEYSCTPEHLPIFEAMGTVEDGDFEVSLGCYKTHEYKKVGEPCLCGNNQCTRIACQEYAFPLKQNEYAIPKAKNEDVEKLWLQVIMRIQQRFLNAVSMESSADIDTIVSDFAKEYSLTRKK